MDKRLEYTLSLKDQFKRTMLSAQAETSKLDSGMSRLSNTIKGVFGGIAGYFTLGAAKDFAVEVVKSTANMQRFENAIVASSRSEGEGRANIRFLNEEVDRLGLNLDAAQKGYKTFTGALMGSNLQGARGNKIFDQVSLATSALGLSAEEAEGSFLALGQMLSKGTVQAEELRGQLAERIPGAFQIGARAMGMTTKELGDAMKDGLIKSEDFLVKFGNELEKTFGSKVEAATSSLSANLNRMGNEWERLKANIGNSQQGIINGTVSWVGQMVRSLNDILSKTNEIESAFKQFGAKDFSFFEKNSAMISSGFNSDFGEMLQLQGILNKRYLDTSTGGKTQALDSENRLLMLMSRYSKSFANKNINEDQYKRGYALMEAALGKIRANKTLNDVTGKKEIDKKEAAKGAASLGSATEISGARPQNINITVNDGLVKQMFFQFTGSTPKQMAEEIGNKIRGAVSKVLLEELNDVNTIPA